MKILILEGIATSGKSTIIDKLIEKLHDLQVAVYSESDTHIPIMNKTSELHITFFQSLIAQAIEAGVEVVIFDRLYLTQAFRAKATLNAYKIIEDQLSKYSTLMAFLKVDEDAIAERVRLATLHREDEWGEYVKTKGNTFAEIADYYIQQQRNQLTLLEQSDLPYTVFDTTNHNYDQISANLIDTLRH